MSENNIYPELKEEWTQELINILAVVSRPGGIYVIEKPNPQFNKPMFELGGPFKSLTAAELFKLRIIEETVEGGTPEALSSLGYLGAYNHAARQIECLHPARPAKGLLRDCGFPANARCAPGAKK